MFTIDCVHLQGGRSWQPKNFRQARICFFRDNCVVLQSCKFSIICIISGWVSFQPLHQLHLLHWGGVQQQLILITGRRCLCSKGQRHQPQDHEVHARCPHCTALKRIAQVALAMCWLCEPVEELVSTGGVQRRWRRRSPKVIAGFFNFHFLEL